MNFTPIQHLLADIVENALKEKLGTEVKISRVEIGLFNRVILHDVYIEDRQRAPMLTSNLMSAKIEYRALLDGRVSLRSVSLLDGKINLYKTKADSAANYQFVLDAFKSDSKGPSHLNLTLNSLIIRRLDFGYEEHYKPQTPGRLNASHLCVNRLNANISLKTLTQDSINLRVRSLDFKEQSGLDVQSFSFRLAANKRHMAVTQFELRLPHSQFTEDELQADYDLTKPGVFLKTVTLHGQIEQARISLNDLSCFVPVFKKTPYALNLSAKFDIKPEAVKINTIRLEEENKRMSMQAHAFMQRKKGVINRVNGSIDKLHLESELAADLLSAFSRQKEADIAKRLGSVDLKANGFFESDGVKWVNADATSPLGNLYASLHWRGEAYMAQISSSRLQVADILGQSNLPKNVTFHADVHAKTQEKQFTSLSATVLVDHAEYQGYTYQGISLNGEWDGREAVARMALNDLNADFKAEFQGAFNGKKLSSLQADINVKRLNTPALHLNHLLGSAIYMGHVQMSLPSVSAQLKEGKLSLSQFFKLPFSPEASPYHLKQLEIKLTPSSRGTHACLTSDFANVDIDGPLSLPALKDNLNNLLSCALPTLSSKQRSKPSRSQSPDCEWSISAQLLQPDFFQAVLNLPIDFDETVNINGYLSPCGERSALLMNTPRLDYGSLSFKDFRCYLQGDNGDLSALIQGKKRVGETDLKVALNAETKAGKLHTTFRWDDGTTHRYQGALNAVSDFSKSLHGKTCVNTEFIPSQFVMADTLWQIAPSRVTIDERGLQVSNFSISHNDQSLNINGLLSSNTTDSLRVHLNKIEVSYILSLIDLKPVSFSGKATGLARLAPNSAGNICIKANLHLPEFRFNDALMGDAHIRGDFSTADKRLHLKANINEAGVGSTMVNGYVGIGEKGLDLHVASKNTTLLFLRRYLPDIFSNLNGRTTGNCRIHGPFKEIDFEGTEQANIYATVNPIGTSYHLADGTVNISSGTFSFENYDITDDQGGRGRVRGTLLHDHLKNIRYDFTADSKQLRIYDRPRSIDMPFYATANGTGRIHLYGKPGAFSADIDMRPDKGTLLVYTVDNPETSTDGALLQFRNKADVLQRIDSISHQLRLQPTEHEAMSADSLFLQASATKPAAKTVANKDDDDLESSTNIRLNFRFDMAPEAKLRVVTDAKTGDNITLSGTGSIRATYYNKGNFQMFGTYTVQQGLFKMVIQDVIHKDFQMQQGGTINFAGDPYEADLDLKAVYTVPSVSLADLGFNFADKSVRADCILNLGGKAGAPQVTFGLNLPTVSDDVKQMVRQLIATDEDMNRQILYLLGVGRFYNYNYAATDAAADGQSQSSVAMKSFLSNTLSGQLNNIISNAIGASNWTFGANLSTGQVGWSDMEVGGLLSGRLLNNRLQVNGMFGYRERPTSTTNFVGDFDINYLLTPSGNISLKAYSETNDRYFSKSSMTTQGVGILLKRDFKNFKSLFRRKKKGENSGRKKH